MKHQSDEHIMLKVSNGELELTRILFERYHVKIYNFILQMARDKSLSQDLTQEVFYKVLKYRHTYNNGKFSSWIYTIAKNTYMDHYKSVKHHPHRLDDVEHFIKDTNQNSKIDLEITDHLNIALDQLHPSDKMLIVMNRFQDIKYQEIAEILGSTPGAIKTKMHRAITKLKTVYLKTM